MPDFNGIQPGDLRHSVTVLTPTAQRTETGRKVNTWATLLSTRAAIQSSSSGAYKASFGDNTETSESCYLITVRYPGNAIRITPGLHVLHNRTGKTYLINRVDNVQERNRVLRLDCTIVDDSSE